MFENGQATQISYLVYVNGQVIDQSFPIIYNYDLIQKSYLLLSNNSSLCKPSYPLSHAFKIITSNKLCDSTIDSIQVDLTSWYKGLTANTDVVIKILKSGIEDLVDDYS